MIYVILAFIWVLYALDRVSKIFDMRLNFFNLTSYLAAHAKINRLKELLSGEPDSLDAYVNDNTHSQLQGLTEFAPIWKSLFYGFFYLKPKHVLHDQNMIEFIPDRFPSPSEVASAARLEGFYTGVLAKQINTVEEMAELIEKADADLKNISNGVHDAEI